MAFWFVVVVVTAWAVTAGKALSGGPAFSDELPDESQPYVSNCFVFALRCWWRFGGYVPIRKSDYGWWPHLLWSPDLKTYYDFTPIAPKRHRKVPPWRFLGKVRKWDGQEVR